jgi:CheY-like chemotaxis protein
MSTETLRRILLVEDELDIQMVARMVLEDLGGFEVEVASSGHEALEKAPALCPDLILLDVMMPGLDGPETLEALSEIPAVAETPVVFVTAKAQTGEVAEYRRSRVVDVITKPFDPMALADLVREIWNRYQSGRSLAPKSNQPESNEPGGSSR